MAESSNISFSNVHVTTGHVTLSDGVKLYYEIRSPKSAPNQDEQHKMVMIMGAFCTLKLYEERAKLLVDHFSKSAKSVQILTFDNRGIGKSAPAPLVKQTSTMLAEDTLALINQIWGEKAAIHVYGASLGGMIAQELAARLVQTKRLASLYLMVTSRGSQIRPLAALPVGVVSALINFVFKSNREKLIREDMLPACFSPEVLKDQGERIAQMWLSDYDNWFAFDNRDICASQVSAVASHYLAIDRARLIREANVPITVQISTKDKVIPPKKQRELAKSLNAKTVIFDQGHTIAEEAAKKALFESVISHLENAFIQA